MNSKLSILTHGVAGWALCGATIAVGRQVVSIDTALVVHAVVAPVAFGLLTWHHYTRHPHSPPAGVAMAMLGIVVALDGLLVAPVFERSYAMFRSVIGTWVPFALIFTASYLAGRAWRRARHGQRV